MPIVALVLVIAVIVAVVVGLVYLYMALVWVGINVTALLDNTLQLWPGAGPVVAWTMFGAVAGGCAGIWRGADRHRIGYLLPVALIGPLLLLGGAAILTRPLEFDSPHPFLARRHEEQVERHRWEREHAYCVKVGRAYVRNGPSTRTPVIASLPRGAIVFVESRSGAWAVIQYRRGDGVLSRGYVRQDLIAPFKQR
jgi:hypothetical protein